jgi:hypothetical protein
MMAQLAKAVKSQFIKEMAKTLPAFAALAPDNRGGDLLALRVSEGLVFFVHLSIADNKDFFVMEVASNSLDAYPWKVMPGQLRDVAAASTRDVWRFRISKLWGEAKEHWWVLGQEPDRPQTIERLRNKALLSHEDLPGKLNEVEPKVREAVGKVCRYAVPYFELAAKHHGHDLKIEVPPV